MLIASEKIAPPVGEWLRYLGVAVFLAGCVTSHFLHDRYDDLRPWNNLVMLAGLALAMTARWMYRRGTIGDRRSLRRLTRRSNTELEGTIRPVPGDSLAHAAPIAVQRPRKEQPGYRSLSARAFDLELDDGRRVRVEPLVAVLDAPTDTVDFGTRVAISGALLAMPSYREAESALRGTEDAPVVIRVERESLLSVPSVESPSPATAHG